MPGRCAIRLSLHVERKDQRKVAQETEGGGVPAMQRESKGGSVCISKIERRGGPKDCELPRQGGAAAWYWTRGSRAHARISAAQYCDIIHTRDT